jgi:hypothetical protein
MSAKIVQFVPRARRDRGDSERAIAFRSRPRPDDLAMDHADTAPCEYAPPHDACHDEDMPA